MIHLQLKLGAGAKVEALNSLGVAAYCEPIASNCIKGFMIRGFAVR